VRLGTTGGRDKNTQTPWGARSSPAILPRLGTADPRTCPPAAVVLDLATRVGHRVTGFAAIEPGAGTTAQGAPADLIVFDNDPLAQIDGASPEPGLVLGSPRPRDVIAQGRVLMRNRSLTTIDEDALRERLRTHRRELAA